MAVLAVFIKLLEQQDVQTVVFAQSAFGTDSPKPTRFLMRIFAPLHPAMYSGPPQFDAQGWYAGPLPRQPGGAPLIGKDNGVFRTAQSAAWPPALCKWTAEAILTSFSQECTGGGEFFDNAEVQKKRKAAENEEPEGKRRKIQQGVKSSVEVDPMKPIFPGGHGPPRTCRWKGLQAPFHDGGGLASPGRWPPSRRKKVLGEEWTKIRLQLRMEAVKRLGSVAEV